MPSESVTWVRCPTCGRLAAVGWLDEAPVEFDCPSGCVFTPKEVRSIATELGWSAHD